MRVPIPPVVLIYGLLGLIPFLAPPLATVIWPRLAPPAFLVLTCYGALILSFLGGARWGLALCGTGTRAPDPIIISLAMLPSIAGLVLLAQPSPLVRVLGLALALVLVWLWDLRAKGLPPWYGALRTMLTAGAVLGLVAGAALMP